MREIADAIRTARLARLLFDNAAMALGDSALVHEGDRERLLFLRDAQRPELIAPWPLLRYRDPAPPGGSPATESAPPPTTDYGLPSWRPDSEGQRPTFDAHPGAWLRIGWGHGLQIRYDERGRVGELSSSGSSEGAAGDFDDLSTP